MTPGHAVAVRPLSHPKQTRAIERAFTIAASALLYSLLRGNTQSEHSHHTVFWRNYSGSNTRNGHIFRSL